MMTIVQKHPGDFNIDGGKRNRRNRAFFIMRLLPLTTVSKEKTRGSVCVRYMVR